MLQARLPENEEARLQDLYRTGLLDSPQEDEFNDIVKFASVLCDMPISLISLVDSDRQWFKARIGLEAPQTDREISFCSHAILQDHLFEIPDTLQDNRFFDNPLVTDFPAIRYYAGMPLVTGSGNRLGTLCVIDNEPRVLTDLQKFGLKVLADNVIKIAELRIKNKRLHYLSETQKTVISILAHDVRNPLASIKSIIGFKQSDIIDTEDATEMIEMVSDQLDNTIGMVDNVVRWGELQMKFARFNYTDFNLYQLVESVFALESLNAYAKNNTLVNNVFIDTLVNSDMQAIEFVLRNLVSNANKYTQDGSITVNMTYVDKHMVIEVTDTGIGMNAEKVGKLLSAAKEDHNSTLGTNNEKGSGLGLLLVREFIDRLNGTVTVKSELGIGTSFKIMI
ncbi:GAF domain-containing sensor histidine kinase [Mucilaginibacter rubeus]|uniref:histidine kinase n=1 Tax=Mucilaginibacter rubeus TaxID=2027860 RepID=A0A5C1HWL9_9SPHI|nr:GAF domain-containing sensor histidine kinase [Mucilaginibacter rubeus]QEM10296.1 GAF domain-containing sensor histidine kinase [Mucilaginibacter rubeus]